MDVTSLLNRSAETKVGGEQEANTQTPELHVNPEAAPWAGLPTPSPEQTPPRISADCRTGNKSRTPWDAGGYSLPLSLDTKFHPTNTAPVIYSGDSLDVPPAPIHSAITPSSGHSRTTSLESSPAGAVSSALVSPMTSSRPLGPTPLAEPTSQLEISTCRRDSVGSDADAQLTARRPSFLDRPPLVTPAGSPKSTKHKFSDSHSSLSSYAPSSQSGGHSRISSFSTAGLVHSGNSSSVGEIPSIEENSGGDESIKWETPGFGGSRPLSPGVGQPSNGLPLRLGALNKEIRPRSPSDAFLISRPTRRPSLERSNLLPQPPEEVRDNSAQDRLNPLPNSVRLRQTRSPIHKHKRAISAPNFFRHPHIAFNSRLDTLPEPQPLARPGQVTMSSGSSDGPEQSIGGYVAPTMPPARPLPALTFASEPSKLEPNSLIRCEKDPECDMETPPRKMISQFFGRNKSCTKAIPRHVWLHFCRKHYQRERYQRGPDYPKLQSELLLEQVRRIQSFSDENVAKGETSGVLRGWKLQLRKREEDRQSRNNADSDDEDGIAAVPQWLLDSAGDNHQTDQILVMMERLRDDIHSNEVRGMPEVELLPDITTDQPKGPSKRRATRALKTHRRAKSQGASRVTASGPTNAPPGFPGIPTVALPGSRVAASHLIPGGPPSGVTAAALPELDPVRRLSLGSSQQPTNETSPAPRVEKRKAEESLESSMMPRSTRRAALPHRPALQRVQEERGPQSALHIPPVPGHSRSRSDVSHRYSGGHGGGNLLPSFSSAFGPASDDVRAVFGSSSSNGETRAEHYRDSEETRSDPYNQNHAYHPQTLPPRRGSTSAQGPRQDGEEKTGWNNDPWANSWDRGYTYPVGSMICRLPTGHGHGRRVSTPNMYPHGQPPAATSSQPDPSDEPSRLPSIQDMTYESRYMSSQWKWSTVRGSIMYHPGAKETEAGSFEDGSSQEGVKSGSSSPEEDHPDTGN